MIKNALTAIGATARDFLRNWRAMAVFSGLYTGLLVVLYLFVATKEASVWQLIFTALLAIVAPILFFMIQAAGVRYTQAEARPGFLLRHSLKDFWKLLLISLPLIFMAVLVVYLLNKLQTYLPVPGSEAARPELAPSYPPAPGPPTSWRWSSILLSSLRLLLLGVVLPLAAIHLWIAIAREGLIKTLKRALRILVRAFTPQSLLIYTIGLIIFGLMPYFLLFTRTPVNYAWAELSLLGIRLALAFVFTLWGWIITLGALTKTSFMMAEKKDAPAQ